jgi:nucleotide-binding universal stress UspA family protein
MKILIAYDASPSADYAVDEVAKRPWPAGTEVRLVTVLEQSAPVPPEIGVELYGPVLEKIRMTQRQSMQQALEKAAARLKGRSDLHVDWELRDGAVNRGLLDAIKTFGAELVVAGSHGATALERFFLGSVSHALVTHSPCSVEIVKKPHPEGAPAK